MNTHMRFLQFAIATTLLASTMPAQAQPTPAAFEGYAHYVAALLGIQFTPAERSELQQQVNAYWTSRDRESQNTVHQAAANWQRISSQADAKHIAAAMTMTRPDALLELQKAARKGRADSQWLLDTYYKRNSILAPGKPDGLPLTRDMVEAPIWIQYWTQTEIHRRPATPPNTQVIQQATAHAIAQHPTLSGPDQVKYARAAGEWARIQFGWARASDADKLITRSDMGAQLSPQEQAALQSILAGFHTQLNGLRQQQNSMLQGTLQNIRENSDTIMGRGTVWNPATNRWEQQGGILTEYNGTVRVP
jgi:hypothetical protein